MPGGGTHPFVGQLIPDLPLTMGDDQPNRMAELLHTAKPVLIDLAGHEHNEASSWTNRITIHHAHCARSPADALLNRPDGYVAWVDSTDASLPEALTYWFGSGTAPLPQ